jgi:hypothetical protein
LATLILLIRAIGAERKIQPAAGSSAFSVTDNWTGVDVFWGGRDRMLTEALTALASTGGTALVTAMVTDSWEGVKARFARLFGQGDAGQAEMAAGRLEQSRAELASLSGGDLERARSQQETAWRTRLGDLLEQDPSVEQELQILVADVQAQVTGSVGRVEQHAAAFDQAQQVVQGHGVQNVTFGGQGGPGISGR